MMPPAPRVLTRLLSWAGAALTMSNDSLPNMATNQARRQPRATAARGQGAPAGSPGGRLNATFLRMVQSHRWRRGEGRARGHRQDACSLHRCLVSVR